MFKIVPIVEGEGEKKAVPALFAKLLQEYSRYDALVDEPVVAKGRSGLTKPGGLERLIEVAWSRRSCAAILILMDADEDCPTTLAQEFTKRLLRVGVRCTVVTVVAAMEYEAWFLASLTTIAGETIREDFILPANANFAGEAETIRDPKKWLTKQIPLIDGKQRIVYNETEDQLAMTRLIDPVLARANSRSFRRLCHALEQILDAVDNNKVMVTPGVQ